MTVRSDQEWRSKYFHLAMRWGRKIAKVAMARRLAIQMYWMMRKDCPSFPRTLREFQLEFAIEDGCQQYLAACRWPDGSCARDVETSAPMHC